MNYVYILECSDKTLYTGWTNNLERRVEMHSSGKGAKYTRGRTPVKLLYYEVFEDKKEAMRREYRIKRLTKVQKENLIKNFDCNLL